MKKAIIILIVILTGIGVWGVGAYNSFLKKENKAIEAWQQVEELYKRRSDALPEIVNTVKIYATNECDIYNRVSSARSVCSEIKVDLNNITSESIALYRAAQYELTESVRELIALQEKYDALKTNQNFIDIKARLLDIKPHIAEAIQNFENEVQNYNSALQKLPNKYIADLFNVRPIDYGNTAHQ